MAEVCHLAWQPAGQLQCPFRILAGSRAEVDALPRWVRILDQVTPGTRIVAGGEIACRSAVAAALVVAILGTPYSVKVFPGA